MKAGGVLVMGDKGLIDLAQQHFYRTVLCDLLTGRVLRGYAQESLNNALLLEKHSRFRLIATEEYLDNAIHFEWMAKIAEQGNVRWGGRFNRCGYHPKTDQDDEYVGIIEHLINGL